jgi:hypothetical protein
MFPEEMREIGNMQPGQVTAWAEEKAAVSLRWRVIFERFIRRHEAVETEE